MIFERIKIVILLSSANEPLNLNDWREIKKKLVGISDVDVEAEAEAGSGSAGSGYFLW